MNSNIERLHKIPEVVVAELPDGREVIIRGEATLEAIAATNEPTQCEVLRIQVKDQVQLAELDAKYR
jgi:hypothetical protein